MSRTADDEDLLEAARAVMLFSLEAADQIGGVSVVQLRALAVLHREGPTNLAQLAEGMGVTVSTTSRLVDRLVAAGWVDRRTAPHARREISLRLTRRGNTLLDHYDELRLAQFYRCLDPLTDEARDVVLRGLRAFGAASGVPDALSVPA